MILKLELREQLIINNFQFTLDFSVIAIYRSSSSRSNMQFTSPQTHKSWMIDILESQMSHQFKKIDMKTHYKLHTYDQS